MTGSESLTRLQARLTQTAGGAQSKLLRASKSVVESVRGVQVVECLNLSDFGPWFKSCRTVEVADWPPVTANREVGHVEGQPDQLPQLHM